MQCNICDAKDVKYCRRSCDHRNKNEEIDSKSRGSKPAHETCDQQANVPPSNGQ
jgi:hypothetical protein